MRAFLLLAIVAAFSPVSAIAAVGEEPLPTQDKPAAHAFESGLGAELNRELRTARLPNADSKAIVEQLAALGPEVIPLAVRLLEERQLPAIDGGSKQVLSDPQELLVLACLRGFDHREVWSAARAALIVPDGQTPTLAARNAAILAAGCAAAGDELGEIVDIARPAIDADHDVEIDVALDRAVQCAADDIFVRDPRGIELLASSWRRCPAQLLPALIRAAGAHGDARALALFAEVLEQTGDLERLALAELARQRAPAELPSGLSAQLRSRLKPEDPVNCQAACAALGALGDFESIESLTELLSDASPGIRASAHRALMTISGLRLPAQAAGWTAWRVRDLAWYRERAGALEAAIVDGTAKQALAAIAEISLHRWERNKLSDLLEHALTRYDASVVLKAREALCLLDSPRTSALLARLRADQVAADAARTVNCSQEIKRDPASSNLR